MSTYVVMLYCGCILGTIAGAVVAGRAGLDETRFVDATILLLVPALIGARLLFVAQHWSDYRHNLSRLWRRNDGGAALYGGLILAVLLSPLVLGALNLGFWRFWDAASVTMLVGLIVTRFGCLAHGCCAGHETAGWLGRWLPDATGRWARRYPSQLFEAGWAVLILGVVIATALDEPRGPAGTRFVVVVAAYAAGRVALDSTRAVTGPRDRAVNIALSGLFLATALAVAGFGWAT